MITTCLQTSGGSSVWADCSRVPEAHQPLAQAEEDGVRLPGHDYAHDYTDGYADDYEDLNYDDDVGDDHPPTRSCQLTRERPPPK